MSEQTITTTKDEYRILAQHGQGGFGITYRAARQSDQLEVIIKMLRMERLSEWKSLELFEREVQILKDLSHPNIPAYIDSFSQGDPPSALGLIQTFVPGQDLARTMREGPRLSEDQMLSWFSQMLEVLDYLHRLSPPVIHRDITPKNILIRPDGKAFLLDFGAVQAAVLTASTLASTAAGTFGYAPMEQFMGRAFPASDLYGLGMTYLAVATGKQPEELELDGVRVNVRKNIRGNARMTLLLHDMTEPDPGRRLASAREALERIAPLLQDLQLEASAAATDSASRAPAAPGSTAPDSPLPGSIPRTTAPPTTQSARAGAADDEAAQQSEPGEITAAWLIRQKERLDRLGGKAAMSARYRPLRAPENFVLSADGAKLLLSSSGAESWVIDLEDLSVERGSFEGAAFNDEVLCVSPDLRLQATRRGDSGVRVNDIRSGKRLQQIQADVSHGIAFSPDAHYLVCMGQKQLRLYGLGGEQSKIAGNAIAFGADGRTVAVAVADEIRFGELQDGKPEWHRGPFATEAGHVRRLAYRSDDRLVVAVGDSGASLIDPDTGELVSRLATKPWGDVPVTNVGFTPDGLRVIICGEQPTLLYSRRRGQAAFLWSIEGRYLGAVGLVSDRPFAQLENGFYDWLDKDKERGDFWAKPEMVKSVLCQGKSPDELLSERNRLLVADYLARYRFLEAQRDSDRIAGKQNITMVLDACRGLTHLLPLIFERAAMRGDGPVFGAKPSARKKPSSQDLVAATKKIAAYSAAERQVLYEDLVQDLSEREAKARQREEMRALEREEKQAEQRRRRQEETQRRLQQAAQARESQEREARLQQAQTFMAHGLSLERQEDGKWFRRKDYSETLQALEQALALGHPDAASAVARVQQKLEE